jgi:ABC-type molybdate transport system permease subunit
VLLTWLALAAMAAIFVLQPTIVGYTHELLFGQGFVPSQYDQRVFAQYFSYGWWALAVAWIALEAGGFMLIWRYKASSRRASSGSRNRRACARRR